MGIDLLYTFTVLSKHVFYLVILSSYLTTVVRKQGAFL